MRRGGAYGAILGLAALAMGAGCGATKSAAGLDESASKVEPGRLAGLPAAELTEVNARRSDVDRARRAEADARRDHDRVRAAVADEKGYHELAKAERRAAEERAKVSRGEVLPGEERRTGQAAPDGGPQGMSDLRAAELKEEAAKARLAYAEALEAYAAHRTETAAKLVRFEQARLDQASFDTLARNRPADARRVEASPAELASRVTERQKGLSDARIEMRRHLDEAQSRHEVWRTLSSQLRPEDRGAALPGPESLPTL
jgi:hypothetical protein